MGIVNFDSNMIKKANELLKLHENIKESKDVEKISIVISNFNKGLGYDLNYVLNLNETLRKDYPAIDVIENIANSLPSISSAVPSENSVYGDPYIENLNWDHKGILATVLLKHSPEFKLAEFIVKVVT